MAVDFQELTGNENGPDAFNASGRSFDSLMTAHPEPL